MLGKATATVRSSCTVSCNIGQFLVIFSQLQSTSFFRTKGIPERRKPETESLKDATTKSTSEVSWALYCSSGRAEPRPAPTGIKRILFENFFYRKMFCDLTTFQNFSLRLIDYMLYLH